MTPPAGPLHALPPSDKPELGRLQAAIESVVFGKSEVIRDALCAVLAGGHLLLEDVPGVGKTTLSKTIALALGCSFSRIQFTADLLPGDVTGVPVYMKERGEFQFHSGPLFAQVVLADEINRSPPKTQSALLEAMNEGQVTVDGEAHVLPRPFVVLATQNPLEHHGTYPLPESQLDRFLMRLSVGYPDPESERLVLQGQGDPDAVDAVLTPAQVVGLQDRVERVLVHRDLEDYVLRLLAATRTHPRLRVGISPRGGQALVRSAKARAVLADRDHVIPDDIRHLAPRVLTHRLVLAEDPRDTLSLQAEARAILDGILATADLPL